MNQKTIHEFPRRNQRSGVEAGSVLMLTEADELCFLGP